jgi:hypothetical protein
VQCHSVPARKNTEQQSFIDVRVVERKFGGGPFGARSALSRRSANNSAVKPSILVM